MPSLTTLWENKFLRHNAIYFAGSMAVAFLNYLYHPILSRLLDLQNFGEVQAIFSLSVQIGIVLNVLGLVTLNIIANKEHDPSRESLLSDIQSIAIYVMLAVCAVLFLAGPSLERTFQFDSLTPFFILIILLLSSLPVTFRRSYLQAQHDFTGVSLSNIIISGGRLIAAIGLVLTGLGTFGALGALVVAQALALIYLLYKTRGTASLSLRLLPKISTPLLRELGYVTLTLVSIGFVSFLTSADILFAKAYFDPDTAGAYSGISTIARIIFFSTSSIAAVLMPSVRMNHTFKEHSRMFMHSLALLLLIGISALTLFFLFPFLIVHVLIGQKFLVYAPLLPRLAFVTFVASIVNLGIYYFLALREYRVLGVVLLGTIATIVPLTLYHRAPIEVVNGFLSGSTVTFVLLCGLFMRAWYVSSDAQPRTEAQ